MKRLELTNLHTNKVGKLFNELKAIGFVSNRLEIVNNTCIVEFKNYDKNKLQEYCKKYNIFIQEKTDNTQKQKQQNTNKQPSNQQLNSIHNPSFYFYKDEDYGKDIEKFSLKNTYENLFSIDGAKTFELTTTYPGLLVGSGYNHPKLKDNKDDFQLGFFFDHTTGLPLISGSSIKGVLRSVLEKEDFCKEVYKMENSNTLVDKLFKSGKAIFYDAFIIDTKNKDKKIFGNDYITSHTKGELKEPNPIKFLKILPDVTFKFQFGNIDKTTKDFFKNIILDFGLGAKTNVGYGKFAG